MPMLFRFENAQTIFSPQFIKALGGICSRFAFRNANLLPSALATDSLTSTFSLYVFLIFLFVFLCLLSCLLLLHQVNVQRRFAKQIFLYLFISNVARISPLCVLCVWLSNPLLTKYSLNSWTGTINPYQAVRTQILCFVFRSLSFKKKTRNLFSSPSSCSCPLLYSLDSKVASAVRSQFYCSRQSHIQIDIYLCDLMLHCKAAATVAEDTCHLRTSINVVALVVVLRMDSFHFTWK